MKKLLFFLILTMCCTMIAPLLFAGGEEEKAELKILIKSGTEMRIEVWKELIAELAPELNVELVYEVVDYNTLHDKIVLNEVSGSGSYDLYWVVTDWVPEFVQGGYLEVLNSYLESDPIDDWPNAWPQGALELQTMDGKVYGITAHAPSQMFFYRTDLFNNENEKSNFFAKYGYELAPPVNFKQYKDIADFFTRPDKNLYGTAYCGKDPQLTVQDFITIGHNMGADYWDQDGKPNFNSTEWVKALVFLGKVYEENNPPNSPELDVYARAVAFAEGLFAMYGDWMNLAFVMNDPEKSNIVGKFETTLWPGDVRRGNQVGYWIWSIPKSSTKKDLAYQYIKILASEEGELKAVLADVGIVGARYSTMKDPGANKIFPQYKTMVKVYDGNYFSIPKTPYASQIYDVLKIAIQDYIIGKGSAQQLLDKANAKIVEIFEE